MNNNQKSGRKSPKGIFTHKVENLTHRTIHLEKEEKESNLYPSDEISEELEDISFDNDGSPSFSTFSSSFILSSSSSKFSTYSSDISRKSEIRYRSAKASNLNKSDEASSKADQAEAKQNILILVLIIVVIFVIVVSVYFFIFGPHKETAECLNIDDLMSDIESKFKTQPSITFRLVRSAIKSAISEDSMTPGILVLVASKKGKHKSREFASHIAKILSESPITIKSDSSKSPEDLKREIDNTIQRNMSEKELKAIIVNDLDLIPFEAAMIFRSYCDHENAQFKRALYIMTVTSYEEILPSSNSKFFDELASQRLNSVWKNDDDIVPSLISRLTVSVAGITA